MSYGGEKKTPQRKLKKYFHFRYRLLRKYLATLHPVGTKINENFNTTEEKLR